MISNDQFSCKTKHSKRSSEIHDSRYRGLERDLSNGLLRKGMSEVVVTTKLALRFPPQRGAAIQIESVKLRVDGDGTFCRGTTSDHGSEQNRTNQILKHGSSLPNFVS